MKQFISPFSEMIRLKKYQRKFMEKKIKRTPKNAKSVSQNSEEKTIIITIIVALVILSALLVNLVVFTPRETEQFSALYYLDSEKRITNLPETVLLDHNSTFSLWLGVNNQNNRTLDYQVQMKMDDGNGQLNHSSKEPIQSFEVEIEQGATLEFPVTINIEQLGINRIIFELWLYNTESGKFDIYSGKWVNLSVEAI